MDPTKRAVWLAEQKAFWDRSDKKVTRPFFEALKDGAWKCQRCELPDNPNWARRFQDIKELGYTVATSTSRYCDKCRRNTTQMIMLRLPRGGATGYEMWSPALRERIVDVLGHHDAYEDCVRRGSLLPDHKFPEIRWDEQTRAENADDMSDAEIRDKFQLLSNQRNQQKREVCRACYQTGKRGTPYGVKFFHAGDENWPKDVPKVGAAAKRGCVGCGWYDLKRWRDELNKLAGASKAPLAAPVRPLGGDG
jgi:hypothetical protein